MSQKIPNKNKDVLKELEKTISPVLVLNNSALKPYVELFEYAPENIYQQPLGSLVGFFEVKEFSEESAYIVNHLTAVLKKEYYINPKRPVTESLDSALHKINMALAEIARIGSVEWLGKINAAICVLEKNNAHFSVSGNAKIFLHRNNILSEISEDLASDELEPHPLKTFINVSSGRLEKNDRLLITSEDIFHILPATEIDKNFQRFKGEKFVQFLRTALSNQMEMLPSVIVEMIEPAPVVKAMKTKNASSRSTEKASNFFSEQTFANSTAKDTLSLDEQPDEMEAENMDASNYTDKKTGHIYIQGEATGNEKNTNSQMHMYQDLAKEKITQGFFMAKNELRKRFSLYKKQLAKKRALRQAEKEKQAELEAEEKKRLAEQKILEDIENEQRLAEQKELEKIRLERERAMIAEQELLAEQAMALEQEKIAQQEIADQAQLLKNEKASKKESATSKANEKKQVDVAGKTEIEEFLANNHELSFREKLERAKLEQQGKAVIDLKKIHEVQSAPEEIIEDFTNFNETEIETGRDENISKLQTLKLLASGVIEKISPILQQAQKTTAEISKKLWVKMQAQKFTKNLNFEKSKVFNLIPHFSKIKQLFSHFSGKQKMLTAVALILIFVAPLFIVRFLNKPKTATIAEIEVIPMSQIKILASEKNINFNTEIKSVFASKDIVSSLIANDVPIAITKNSITTMKNGQVKEFPLPIDLGAPIKATYMNDLSLIFIITDANKIISFSPVSEKFTQSNNIDLSNIPQTSFIGTYLTYLYVLDQKASQIYRFPRAEGGFGEKTEWLKDSTSLTGATEMTIDDNIYAVANNKVLKFFKGKTVPFELEASNTPVVFSKIYTTPDLQSFYALDTQNSRVIQYGKDGNIIAQFFNDALKDASSLSVDEKNKVAYLATSSGLVSLSLQ